MADARPYITCVDDPRTPDGPSLEAQRRAVAIMLRCLREQERRAAAEAAPEREAA